MIIQALSKEPILKPKAYKPKVIPDIIVTNYREEEEYEGDTKIIKRVPVSVNLTKKINATAKLIKKESVQDIEAKLDEVFEVKKMELEATLKNTKAQLKKEIKQ